MIVKSSICHFQTSSTLEKVFSNRQDMGGEENVKQSKYILKVH